ncbi:Acid_phosphatase [Hexamita inflata]|uniref:Acid_phosphatase n=1 Tax=Hexamita inflata TaxID=28002 RepID=A0ABP1I5L8_9EUKA
MLVFLFSQHTDFLKNVIIHTRHGARTPLSGYPNDPAVWNCAKNIQMSFQPQVSKKPLNIIFDVKKELTGTCSKGQLSDQGFTQHVHLSNLWSKLYPFKSFELYSTTVPRVRLSLLGQLQNVQSQNPFQVQVSSKLYDQIFLQGYCPNDYKYQKLVYEQIDLKEKELKDLQKRTGWSASQEEDFADSFQSRDIMGVSYPESVTEADKKTARDVTDDIWHSYYYNQLNIKEKNKYLKMTIGMYMKDLKYSILDGVNKIVSGHDMSIAPLAGILVENGEFYGQLIKITNKIRSLMCIL